MSLINNSIFEKCHETIFSVMLTCSVVNDTHSQSNIDESDKITQAQPSQIKK